ncbi:hypothetical protein [Halomonas denitrificans]|nr:hypothetical protein [Halomonas denitrificans]
MKKLSIALVAGLLLVAVTVLVGREMAPTVHVQNRSDHPVREFVVELPTSRVSIGPVAPDSAGRVFFAPQAAGGTLSYRAELHDGRVASGEAAYAKEGQWFRTLRFTVHADGSVALLSEG